MGWLGDFESVSEIKNRVLSDRGDGYKVIEHASTNYGRNLWVRMQHPQGYEFIALYLMQKSGGAWAYKSMDESCGPVEVDCPIKFINAVPMPSGQYVAAWRERVRAHHAKRAVEFSEGEEVLIYGKNYKVLGKIKRSYRVQRLSDGAIFKCGATKMHKIKEKA